MDELKWDEGKHARLAQGPTASSFGGATPHVQLEPIIQRGNAKIPVSLASWLSPTEVFSKL